MQAVIGREPAVKQLWDTGRPKQFFFKMEVLDKKHKLRISV
jgi:hypothetical protein